VNLTNDDKKLLYAALYSYRVELTADSQTKEGTISYLTREPRDPEATSIVDRLQCEIAKNEGIREHIIDLLSSLRKDRG
jgi:hypothetical protein